MRDTRNRSERRADPDQWYQLVGHFDGQTVPHELNGKPVFVRGKIGDVLVVQMPSGLSPKEQFELFQGTKAALEGAGINHSMIVVPEAVKFLKLRPIDSATGKKLDRISTRQQLAEAGRSQPDA